MNEFEIDVVKNACLELRTTTGTTLSWGQYRLATRAQGDRNTKHTCELATQRTACLHVLRVLLKVLAVAEPNEQEEMLLFGTICVCCLDPSMLCQSLRAADLLDGKRTSTCPDGPNLQHHRPELGRPVGRPAVNQMRR